jgi:hypothetical protein
MRKPSDEFTRTRLYQEDARLRAMYARYVTEWTSFDAVTKEAMMFDIGYLFGVLVKVEREGIDAVVTAEAETPEAWEACEDEPEPD